MSGDWIVITGAREHNLKGVTVRIPRNRLTVVTGLSGSGKSSLVFDTLYAEGQRRYVESLSAYARQFLDQMEKPDVDRIDGLSPAIAIQQRTAGANPRSTVATTTEVHDFLRLLYANIGVPHCPECGLRVSRQTPQQIVAGLMELPSRTRLVLLAPVVVGRKGRQEDVLAAAQKSGYVRARVDGELYEMESVPRLDAKRAHTIEIVVDRLIVTSRVRNRLTDSMETALKEGRGGVVVMHQEEGKDWGESRFSEKHACPDCGISFDEMTPRCFSFNSPYGACPTCSGLGTRLVPDADLAIPNPDLSINDGAIQAWRKGGRRLILYYRRLLRAVAKHYEFSVDTPFGKLPARVKKILLYGSGKEELQLGHWRGGAYKKYKKVFEGVIPNLRRRYETTPSEYTRQRLRSYMSPETCPDCRGARLRPEVLACTIGGKSIADVARMSIREVLDFLSGIRLSEQENVVVGDVLKEIRRRLEFMAEVGLDYITLHRESGTLSGGEIQRIRLATQIGAGLVGVLYVLDEPTIGLHLRDNKRLITLLKNLRDAGNTVVVVEHDEEMIRAADHVVDLGPGAGSHGGEVVHEGPLADLLALPGSLTARYLNRGNGAGLPTPRKAPGGRAIKVAGATENNLKDITVSFPLGLLVCVTGVSGSGKSTLVDDILRRALSRKMYGSRARPGSHRAITGADKLDGVVVIDQSPIGRTPRSNPATYTGVFSVIRKLFAQTPAAKVRGYGPGRFSFNVKGGRCEACRGDGVLRLEMHFLPDVYVTCEQCGGSRYNRETLLVQFGGLSVAEVLSMTVDEALAFFEHIPSVKRKLRVVSEVGLGYLRLGQSATTLSGGEAQRVKLSSELSKRGTGNTLYLLDEPTTGLHFVDTERLLQVLLKLRDAGNTVVVIEHNLDVVKAADYVIDLGPEGGDGGGHVVAAGTPEAIAACPRSYTGAFLKEALAGRPARR